MVGHHRRVAVHKSLIPPGNTHFRVQWCKEHRQWPTEQWRNVIWSDESSFTMFLTKGQVHVWHQPKELCNTECLVPTVQDSGGSVILWGTFSWHGLGAVIPLESKVNANCYLMILSDHRHLMLQHFFPARRGVFQDCNAPLPQSTSHFQQIDTVATTEIQ